MNNTIVYCEDNPIKTKVSDWMDEHIDRISVGKLIPNGCEIYAYSDNEEDGVELQKYAKTRHALLIHSILSEGVTAID